MIAMQDVAEYIGTVCASNEEGIDRAARAIIDTSAAGGLVRPAGAGHSLAAVLETFFRAGGLAFVRPLWHERVLPLHGSRASTDAEREEGLGRGVAEAAGITAEDTLVVFSNSGINPYPIEIARVGKDAGAQVIAMTSLAASRGAPLRAGARLFELADIVLDTRVPPGDATWPPDEPRTAAVSSLATTALWTAILRRIDDEAPETPRWRSANVEGTDAFNAALVERFAPRIPEL